MQERHEHRRHHDAFGSDGREGPGGRDGHRGGRGRGRGGGGRRAGRGDVRTAVLLLLNEEPMHGYQIIQAITDRTQGSWRPSPGAVYPALAQLEDEGLVSITAEGGRKLAGLTATGREHVAEQASTRSDPFAEFTGAQAGPDLRALVHEVHAAARQVGAAGTPAQVEAAATVLAETRRALYLLLAGDPRSVEEPAAGQEDARG